MLIHHRLFAHCVCLSNDLMFDFEDRVGKHGDTVWQSEPGVTSELQILLEKCLQTLLIQCQNALDWFCPELEVSEILPVDLQCFMEWFQSKIDKS